MALEGKIAVVTGGAQGLGKGFSEILLRSGAKVAILDVNENALNVLKEEFDNQYGPDKTFFMNCNVVSEEQFKAAFQETLKTFGRVDIFCNNAGIFNETDWEKAVSVNLMCVVRGTYLALEHMNKLTGGHGGVVINIASMAGLGPLLTAPVYTATKHGVVGFTRALAEASKVSGYGIRFNILCPAFVQTDMINVQQVKTGNFSNLADINKEMLETLGILEVSDVSKSFLQLVKDDNKNGEALMVSTEGSYYFAFPKFH